MTRAIKLIFKLVTKLTCINMVGIKMAHLNILIIEITKSVFGCIIPLVASVQFSFFYRG
jgi:hypothetical protein